MTEREELSWDAVQQMAAQVQAAIAALAGTVPLDAAHEAVRTKLFWAEERQRDVTDCLANARDRMPTTQDHTQEN